MSARLAARAVRDAICRFRGTRLGMEGKWSPPPRETGGAGGAGSWMWLPRRMAMCTIFLFLDSATYIRIEGALDYW